MRPDLAVNFSLLKTWFSKNASLAGAKEPSMDLCPTAWMGDIDAMEKFVRQGENVRSQHSSGRTALDLAVWNLHIRVAEILCVQRETGGHHLCPLEISVMAL